jgi:hypothetical protein
MELRNEEKGGDRADARAEPVLSAPKRSGVAPERLFATPEHPWVVSKRLGTGPWDFLAAPNEFIRPKNATGRLRTTSGPSKILRALVRTTWHRPKAPRASSERVFSRPKRSGASPNDFDPASERFARPPNEFLSILERFSSRPNEFFSACEHFGWLPNDFFSAPEHFCRPPTDLFSRIECHRLPPNEFFPAQTLTAIVGTAISRRFYSEDDQKVTVLAGRAAGCKRSALGPVRPQPSRRDRHARPGAKPRALKVRPRRRARPMRRHER